MKVMTAVGARPQFIKAAPVSRALQAAGIAEVLVHSGQHYDHGMSQVFFDELGLPAPDLNLGVGSGPHGKQTGLMLDGFEQALLDHQPDWLIVHGDTNSTLAAALAAVKLRIPIAHNEAGLRSFNREMPEEHNRVLTDHCADICFCPTQRAVQQLAREGIEEGVYLVGDVMYDAAVLFAERAEGRSQALAQLGLRAGRFVLATLHRPYNVDDRSRLQPILEGLASSPVPVVLPCHPRLAARLEDLGMALPANVRRTDPLGYLDMIALERNARLIVTDSGGVQKEAYFYGVPCITARPETEWVETVKSGWNRLVDASATQIADALRDFPKPADHPEHYGDGHAATRLVQHLQSHG